MTKNLIEIPEIILLRVGVMGTTVNIIDFQQTTYYDSQPFISLICPTNNTFLNLLSCCKMCECCCNSKESSINLHVTLTQYCFILNISFVIFKKHLVLIINFNPKF